MADPTANPAHQPLTRAVARALRRRCGISEGTHLLVAVSGGADSVALVRALAALAPRRRWRLTLTLAHVQHHLRGEAAEDDARFVEQLAHDLDLPRRRRDLNPSQQPAQTARVPNMEAWARRERYRALAEMAQEVGATHIATAHHGDDQLETILLRVLRGTSVTGLRGIAWKRRLKVLANDAGPIHVVRPMLALSRADVLDMLKTLGQPWREDHTNADVSRDRARLRRDVLPTLHGLRADVAKRAVRLADHARDMHRLVRHETRRAYEQLVHQTDHHWQFPRAEARRLPRVILTALLRRLLGEAGVSNDRLKRRNVIPIVRAVRDREGGERKFELAGNVTLTVSRNAVSIRRA